MNFVEKRQIQALLRQTGAYLCSFFALIRTATSDKQSKCCGKVSDFTYNPVCKLSGQFCTGLAQCPKLDVATKSNLIKQWTIDVNTGKQIDIDPFTKQ